jgi:hypothetical protein
VEWTARSRHRFPFPQATTKSRGTLDECPLIGMTGRIAADPGVS